MTKKEADDAEEMKERQKKHVARPVSLKLMHRRLGHILKKSLLLREESRLHSDLRIVPDPDGFCETC